MFCSGVIAIQHPRTLQLVIAHDWDEEAKLLQIRFIGAGKPVMFFGAGHGIYGHQDADGNIADLEVHLAHARQPWPAEWLITTLPDLRMKISDEDQAELCRLWPVRITSLTISLDAPIPADAACEYCGTHGGTET